MHKITYLIVILLMQSCSNDVILKGLLNRYVNIPETLEVIKNGQFINDEYQAPIKLVQLYTLNNCTSCAIGSIYYKEKLFGLADEKDFCPMLIISPTGQYDDIVRQIKHQRHPFNVYIDRENAFLQLNPFIPQYDLRYHSFLLDKNNKIVLVGDPTSNNTLWMLYKRIIKNMIRNDGIYVSDIDSI